jgi:LPXTG-motif cell wall-anchored protein
MLLVVEIALVVVGVVVLLLLVGLVARRRRQANETAPQRDERGMQKKKLYFRRDVVERKATSLFPGAARKQTLAYSTQVCRLRSVWNGYNWRS